MIMPAERTARVIGLYREFVRLKNKIIELDGEPRFMNYFIEKFLPRFRREVPEEMQRIWGIDNNFEERLRITYSPMQ